MKKVISRFTMMFVAVFTIAIMAAIPVTALAAEQEFAPVAISEEVSVNEASDNDLMTVQAMVDEGTVIQPLEATPAAGAAGSGDAYDSDTAYQSVIYVILKWVRRLGAAVGLFGAIMLALAFKGNDADGKENGIKVMIAGFLVWAICAGAGLFHLFD